MTTEGREMSDKKLADTIERLERELAEARAARSVTLPEDPRELLVTTARDAGFSDAQWKSMFYEQGPYDITFPSFPMKKFVRLLLEKLQPLADPPPERASAESGNTLAWLIEMSRDGKAHWWYGSDFTDDAAQAIRFAREQDADQVIMERGLVDAVATEHMWCAQPAPAAGGET